MSVKVMTKVWEWSRSVGNTRLVALALADWADEDNVCYPGIARLAKKSRVSQRTAQRCLRELEAMGEIKVIPNAGVAGNGGITNRYIITVKNPEGGGDKLTGGGGGGGDKSGTKVVTNQVKGGDTGVTQSVREPSVEPLESTLPLQNTRSRRRFTPPTLEEVKSKCRESGLPVAEAEAFVHHHAARGWKLGRQPMVSWPNAWGTWVANHRKFNANGNGHGSNGVNGHKTINGVDPEGWSDWLGTHADYKANLQGSATGSSYRFAPEFMKLEFRRETKTVRT